MDNNAWFPDFDIPIPLPPSITAEICLCFDSYLSVEGLDEMIGLPAKCAEPRGAMRINPLTGRQNPGYWHYVLPSCADFGSESLTEQLCGLLTEHATGFRAAMEKYAPAADPALLRRGAGGTAVPNGLAVDRSDADRGIAGGQSGCGRGMPLLRRRRYAPA